MSTSKNDKKIPFFNNKHFGGQSRTKNCKSGKIVLNTNIAINHKKEGQFCFKILQANKLSYKLQTIDIFYVNSVLFANPIYHN